jgi:hypothetical protein
MLNGKIGNTPLTLPPPVVVIIPSDYRGFFISTLPARTSSGDIHHAAIVCAD